MKITENEMRGLLAGKCLPSDILVGENLAVYLVRKFAALQQKLDAAEAKLAAAKAVKEDWKNRAWTAEEQLTEQKQKVDALAAENADLKHPGTYLPSKRDTPATDAILNVVRAEAIRSALNSCSDRLDTDCVMEVHGISYEDAEMHTNGALELHNALLAVATELRASAAKDGK